MKKILLIGCFLYSLFSVGQTEYSDFTSTGRGGAATTFEQDYHALGINPANLGFGNKYKDKKFTIGVGEFAVSAFTNALNKPELRSAIFNPTEFESWDEKIEVSKQFVQSSVAINADITWLGMSFHDDKIGGFGFSIRERVQWFSKFNQNAANIMFQGYLDDYFTTLILEENNPTGLSEIPNDPDQWPALIADYEAKGWTEDSVRKYITQGIRDKDSAILYSDLLDSTRINFSWVREFNFSYGKEFEINDRASFFAGIGLKYLQGFAIMDLNVQKGQLVSAYSAISPSFDIDYGKKAKSEHPNIDTVANGYLDPAGRGLGFDFGVSFSLDKKLKLGIAVINVGSMTWEGNVFQAKNDTLLDLTHEGFNSYNFFAEAEKFTGDEGVMEWEGAKSKKVALPSMLRFGGSYDFADKHSEDSENDTHEYKADIGFDVIFPLNKVSGNIDKPVFAMGGDFRPVKWLDLSTGFRFGGNYGFNIPLGVDLVIGDGTWEFGVATRDVVTYFTKKGPTLSAAVGVLRFRF